MDTIERTETDEERAERIARWRLARALKEAPDLMAHVRAIATNGRVERGDVLGEWSAPMRITAADDSDVVYAQLIDWVLSLAAALKLSPPSATVTAWSIRDEAQGFRAGTVPEGAHLLTGIQTMWLSIHAEQIEQREAYETFREDVMGMLWDLRAKYPLEARRQKPVYARPCPVCGEFEVRASWFSGDGRDVDVACGACGYKVDAPLAVLDWLDWETRENRECTCLYPGDPKSGCPIHHPQPADSETGEH